MEGGSVDDDGQGEVRYTRCVKFGRKECLKGKALMRGMGLKTNKLVVSKYSMHSERRKKCFFVNKKRNVWKVQQVDSIGCPGTLPPHMLM